MAVGALAAGLLLACAACSQASAIGPVSVAGASGGLSRVWVGHDSSSADLLQITVAAGQVTGTLDETDLATGGASTTPHHVSVTGTLSGTALSLTLSSGLDQTTITGSVSGKTISLDAPSTDGTIDTLTFTPGTITSYNALVTSLEGKASTTNEQQQQQAATAAQQQAIDKAAQSVSSDYATLTNLLGQSPDFSQFTTDMNTAKSDLAKAYSDAAQAEAQGDNSNGCYTASTAEYDASSVQYDQSSIQYDNNQLSSALQPITAAEQQLKTDQGTYQTALSAQPAYQGAALPSAQTLAALLNQAASKVSGWAAEGKSYQTQVDTMQSEAQSAADKAQSATC